MLYRLLNFNKVSRKVDMYVKKEEGTTNILCGNKLRMAHNYSKQRLQNLSKLGRDVG